MAKPELTSAWWSKHGPKTLKTGLGEALRAYEVELKSFQSYAAQPGHDHEAVFKKLEDALDHVSDTVKKAEGMCNKLLHKDTLAALAEFRKTLIPREAQQCMKLAQQAKAGFEGQLKQIGVEIKSLETEIRVKERTIDGWVEEMTSLEAESRVKAKDIIAHATAQNQSMVSRTFDDAARIGDDMMKVFQTAKAQVPKMAADIRKQWPVKRGDNVVPKGHNFEKQLQTLDMLVMNWDVKFGTIEKLNEAFTSTWKTIESARTGSLNSRDEYVRIVEADAERLADGLTRVNATEAQLGVTLSGMGEMLTRVEKAVGEERAAELRKAAAALVSAQGLHKQFTKELLAFEKTYESTIGGYPPFVNDKDKDFARPLKNIKAMGKFIDDNKQGALDSSKKIKEREARLKELVAGAVQDKKSGGDSPKTRPRSTSR